MSGPEILFARDDAGTFAVGIRHGGDIITLAEGSDFFETAADAVTNLRNMAEGIKDGVTLMREKYNNKDTPCEN